MHGATTVTPVLEHSLDTCPHTKHPRLSPAEQAPTQTGPTSDNQVCKNYNHKGCKYHKKCRRIHQCLECGVVVVGGGLTSGTMPNGILILQQIRGLHPAHLIVNLPHLPCMVIISLSLNIGFTYYTNISAYLWY